MHGLSVYRSLGLAPDAPYFNTGVLLMNLPLWRDERLGSQIIDYLARERDSIRHADQDGINAVLAGRILELDAHWNVGALETFYGSWEASPFCRELYEDLIAHPKILHFNTPDKPWHAACRHPKKDLFFHYVDRTAWSAWRPLTAILGTGH